MNNVDSARCAIQKSPGSQAGAFITASPVRWVVRPLLATAFYFIPGAMTGFIASVFPLRNRVGDDFFADKDVCSIVLEVPNSALGAKEVSLWARTLAPNDGGWIQVERGARPAQAVILVEERDAYLGGEPANDERFLAAFAHALEHTGGYRPAEAKRVAGTLLPDVLSYDPARPASFPDNGRTLTDDAFDSFIRILTNGKVTEDKVGPHGDLLLEFPYVGPPHQSRMTKAPHKTTAMQNQT
jgi:hypothetical protein